MVIFLKKNILMIFINKHMQKRPIYGKVCTEVRYNQFVITIFWNPNAFKCEKYQIDIVGGPAPFYHKTFENGTFFKE